MKCTATKVKVAGHIYRVEYVDQAWSDDTGNLGNCCASELSIKVLKGCRQDEVLLHEIGHAIYYEYGVGHAVDEEGRNSAYMTGMYQVLIDNPEIRKLFDGKK